LQKKSVSGSGSERFSSDGSSADYWNKTDYTRGKPALLYDALGRRTEPHPETRRRLFQWKYENNVFDKDRDFVLAEGSLFRMVLSNGKICGVEGDDYGIMEDGQHKGGNYCYVMKIKSNGKRITFSKKDDLDNLCGENNDLVNFTFEYKYTPVITKDSIYYVKGGYVFPDGYVTTEQDSIYFRKHELRHKKDTRSIIGAEKKILIDTTICESEFCEWRSRMFDSLDTEREKFYKAKIDSASEYYHDQCYNHKKC
jgi:hypothetical protein